MDANREKRLAPVLMTFVEINLLLVLLCCIAEAFCRDVLHLPQPYNYPVLDPNYSFGDFKCFATKFPHFHHPAFFTTGLAFGYPAPMATLYELFFAVHIFSPLRIFLVFFLATILIASLLFARTLWRRGLPALTAAAFVITTLALAYPIWLDLKQANLEIGVWILVALGVWAFCKGHGHSAAACFGIAGSMKLFPFVYLGLLLAKRKYRETAFSILTAIASTILSLWLINPDIPDTWRKIQAGLGTYRGALLQFLPAYNSYDHCLFALYKGIFGHHLPPPEVLGHMLTLYLAVAALGGIALYFIRIRHLPLINQVMCLCIASILLPPVSVDYTLMHLYIPWAMLVLLAQDRWTAKQKIPGLTAAFVCLAILVSPETEFILHGEGFGAQIKSVVLIVLMYIALKYPFEPAPIRNNKAAALA